MPKKLRPQLVLQPSERKARILIVLIIIAAGVAIYMQYTGAIKPYLHQGTKVETTPIPEPERSILPPRL